MGGPGGGLADSWGYAALHGRKRRVQRNQKQEAQQQQQKKQQCGRQRSHRQHEHQEPDGDSHNDESSDCARTCSVALKCTASTSQLLELHYRQRRSTEMSIRPLSLSSALSSDPRCFDPKRSRISAVNKRITHIDLPRGIANPSSVKSLLLSRNHLRELAGVCSFPCLEQLSLASNCIDDAREVGQLGSACTRIRSLALQGNPLCSEPAWRERVLACMPRSLSDLNGTVVSKEECERALEVARTDDSMLDTALWNAMNILKLEHALKLAPVHKRLRSTLQHHVLDENDQSSGAERQKGLDPRLLLRVLHLSDDWNETMLNSLRRSLRKELGTLCRRAAAECNCSNEQAREMAYSSLLQSQQSLLTKLTAKLDSDSQSASSDRLQLRHVERRANPPLKEVSGSETIKVAGGSRYADIPERQHEEREEQQTAVLKQHGQDECIATLPSNREVAHEPREQQTGQVIELERDLERAVLKLEELEQENSELHAANESLRNAVSERESARKSALDELRTQEAETRKRVDAVEQEAEQEREAIEERWERAFEDLQRQSEDKDRLEQTLANVRAEKDKLASELCYSKTKLTELEMLKSRRELAQEIGEFASVRAALRKLQQNRANEKERQKVEIEMETTMQAIADVSADSQYAGVLRSWQASAYIHARIRFGREQSLLCHLHEMMATWQNAHNIRLGSERAKNKIIIAFATRIFQAWGAVTFEAIQGRQAKLSLTLKAWARRRMRRHKECNREMKKLQRDWLQRRVLQKQLSACRHVSAARWLEAKRREKARKAISRWRRTCEGSTNKAGARKASEMAGQLSKAREFADECRQMHKEKRVNGRIADTAEYTN